MGKAYKVKSEIGRVKYLTAMQSFCYNWLKDNPGLHEAKEISNFAYGDFHKRYYGEQGCIDKINTYCSTLSKLGVYIFEENGKFKYER